MSELKRLPLDKDTLKLLNYNPMYFLPPKPLHSDIAKEVARSTLKFFYNQLDLAISNKNIIDDNIKKLKIMAGE